MRLAEFHECAHLSKEELLAHAYGKLIDDAPEHFVRLPAPPMLMLDRVTSIERDGARGSIKAERDVRVDDWFFPCHFTSDPVQPGCLGVDAIWQMIGLYLGLRGVAFSGRALGCKEVEFRGQIRPYNKLVRYEVDIRRYTVLPNQGTAMAIGTGRVYVDDEHIYTIVDAKVGGFKDIAYSDYPCRTPRAVGGIMER
ncbi:MAG: bifunctional 3-hydroxydecanoyl-ACP dehydratase/trans-2-decenoyl-ACP isomerase [Deltaproteobacteria bacterium]|nr:bifunctional 3-hydroxydecanoyl-ACP dehydratase/trans-2-decenoyl-ACP isomerase [Deltaproteobacteria bacterium]